MARPASLTLVCILLLTAAVAPVSGAVDANGDTPPPEPAILAAYPDPIADGDAGEFVVLWLPEPVDTTEYALTDGDATVPLANVSLRGRVALSAAPTRARNVTDAPVVAARALELANGGERLRLVRNGTVVDRAVYRDTEEGHLATWNGTRIRWRHVDATDRPAVRGGEGRVHAFVLPDASAVPIETIRSAEDRLLLAGYTLTSRRVADALLAADDRGVRVQVLLEGQPVGGRTERGAALLDRLVAAGIEVRLIGGPHAHYAYHHAKYAVADDAALVLTENWKPAGTGGHSSRGWGVRTNQSRIVAGLAATFHADGRDAVPWTRFRRGRSFETGGQSNASYPARVEPATIPVEGTTLLVAPDNARDRLVGTIDRANASVDVVQMSLGWDGALGRALRRAARRGVTVRLLLSDAWYVREDNRALAERFEQWADERDAALEVRLADPGGRYEKIHAKGAVVDDRRVVLGSLNWNDRAATRNREVVLLLRGEAVADYYGRVFDADWQGGRTGLPLGLLAAVAGCLGLAVIVGRKIRFERS